MSKSIHKYKITVEVSLHIFFWAILSHLVFRLRKVFALNRKKNQWKCYALNQNHSNRRKKTDFLKNIYLMNNYWKYWRIIGFSFMKLVWLKKENINWFIICVSYFSSFVDYGYNVIFKQLSEYTEKRKVSHNIFF